MQFKLCFPGDHKILTVFFEDPFWVGVFERIEDGKLSVCKVTFGTDWKLQNSPRLSVIWRSLCNSKENHRCL